MKVLITGGAGFIGSHVADLLIEEGHGVVIVDDLSNGKEENIHPKATFYPLSILDNKLSDIFSGRKDRRGHPPCCPDFCKRFRKRPHP